VAARDAVFGVDGARQRLDGGHVEPVHLFHVTFRVGQAPEAGMQAHVDDDDERSGRGQRQDADLSGKQHEHEGRRGGRGLAHREHREVVTPHVEWAAAAFEGGGGGRDARVHQEVHDRQHGQGADHGVK
jgi:hypothetical protein